MTPREKEIRFCWMVEYGLCAVLIIITALGVLPLPMCIAMILFSFVSVLTIVGWKQE